MHVLRYQQPHLAYDGIERQASFLASRFTLSIALHPIASHNLPYVKRLCHFLDAIFPMGLLAAILWLLAHDSGAFTPCFVPQK